MRLPWRFDEYERTCATCGYAWRVPRSAVRKPIAGYSIAPRGRGVAMGGISPVAADNDPEIAASEAISEVAAAYGQCPKCSGYRYTQRRV